MRICAIEFGNNQCLLFQKSCLAKVSVCQEIERGRNNKQSAYKCTKTLLYAKSISA